MVKQYKIFLVSHNKLAEGVLAAVEMIAGKQHDLRAWGLMPGENPDSVAEKIQTEISSESHVVILADLYGGSMANAVVKLSTLENVKLVTGLNLALALQTVLECPWSEQEIEKVINRSKDNIKEIKLEELNAENDDNFF